MKDWMKTTSGAFMRSGVKLTWQVSRGIGDGDLEWKASWEMKPESWEEMEESRAGVCSGSREEEEEEEVR